MKKDVILLIGIANTLVEEFNFNALTANERVAIANVYAEEMTGKKSDELMAMSYEELSEIDIEVRNELIDMLGELKVKVLGGQQ